MATLLIPIPTVDPPDRAAANPQRTVTPASPTRQETLVRALERLGLRRIDIELDLNQIHSAEAIQAALITSRKKANRESAVALLVLNQIKDHYPRLDSGRKVMFSWRTWARQVLKHNRNRLKIDDVIAEAQKEFARRAQEIEETYSIKPTLAKVTLAIIGAETLSLRPNQKMTRAATATTFAQAWIGSILDQPAGPTVLGLLKQEMELPIDEKMLARYHNGGESRSFVRTRTAKAILKEKGRWPDQNFALAETAATELGLLVEVRKDLWESAGHPDFRGVHYGENFSRNIARVPSRTFLIL